MRILIICMFLLGCVGGNHYDCIGLREGMINVSQWTNEQVIEAVEYCRYDTMFDFGKCIEPREYAWQSVMRAKIAPQYCWR